ncbi:hypothetical protein D3A96_02890 [Robertkochia marina]|nr:hypothetical protein D3A96_02890 [Robertkochia marina]
MIKAVASLEVTASFLKKLNIFNTKTTLKVNTVFNFRLNQSVRNCGNPPKTCVRSQNRSK